ncbi:unnamed protein product [Paramecium octaurelia]|uniref:Transmembrane protein n=1 Tax=Paramecium octaurelia TaxID=43137 RepID=A0A8S1WHL3_PAROT|nr:unnamed protein product [Paramecium octaurelia]
MLFLFIIVGFHFLLQDSKATACETKYVQSKITCHFKQTDCYILEGDEEDYYKLKSIDKNIIEKSFTISYKIEPIQVKIFKLFEQEISKKLICQFLKNQKYYISCTTFDTLNYGQNHHLQESIRIETNILSNENCDEIFQLNDGRIIIFCMTQSHLRQYSVGLDGDARLMLEYEVVDQIQDQCKKTLYNIKRKNQFITAFFQCSRWKIFLINNLHITIILETKMKDEYPSLKYFSKINDISICWLTAQTLYIFEGKHQLLVNYDSIYSQTFTLSKSEHQILKIILLKVCSNNILITYSNESNFQPFQKTEREIIINQTFEAGNIHFFSDYIFFQNETSLLIRIDYHLIQTYEILNTTLNFFEQDKLFYQIDLSNNLIQFYRYFPMSGFIEPKKKFIYIIFKLEVILPQQLDQCFRIQYGNKSNERIKHVEEIEIQRNCYLKQEVVLNFKRYNSYLQQEFSIQNNHNEVINLSIWNEAMEDVKCYQRVKSYEFKNKTQLKSKHHHYLVFQNDYLIYLHNCIQNKIEMIINTNEFEVFRFHEDYYLIDKKNQQLKVISFALNQISQIVLYDHIEITKAQQVQQQLFLYTKNNTSPIIISKVSFLYTTNYLSKVYVQPEQITYYQKLGGYTFFQYPNILAYEFQGDVLCFDISNLVIISIKIWIKNLYQIIAVQNETNSVLLYYTNLIELHQIYNYTLKEYQFSNPLKYSYANLKLVILTEQHSTFFLALFSQSDESITLMDIINTDDTYFEILEYTLFYLKNGQMKQYYMTGVDALINTNISFQKNIFEYYNFTLKPALKGNDDLNLKLKLINECYQLFCRKNSISLRLQKDQKLYLKIPEMFYGPINNLTIQSNQNIYLKNPFNYISQINKCYVDQFICIQEFHFESQNSISKTEYQFFVIILNNKTVFHLLQPPIDDLLNWIFWISDYNFIRLYSQDKSLQIGLLQCNLELNRNCKEIKTSTIGINPVTPLSFSIIKIQNLIRISNDAQQIYLYICNQNFTIINITDYNLDIKYIENSKDLFIGVSKFDEVEQSLRKLRIYQIHFNGYVEIFSDIITKKIENLLPFYNKLLNISLISCRQTENIIVANILVQHLYTFFTVKIQIDIQNGFFISFDLQKQIRNQLWDSNFIINYLDDDYLILNSISADATILFDLSEERLFYDYCYLQNNHIQITRVNTTHFIFRNNSTIHIGMIQNYEIDLREIDDKNFNFILNAQNQISEAQISIHVEVTSDGQDKSIILIQLINMIFILLQLRLGQSLNRQKKQTTLRIQQQNYII